MKESILTLVLILLVASGTGLFGSDKLGVSALQGTRTHEFGDGSLRTYSIRGLSATYMNQGPIGLFANTSVGLLEKAEDFLSESVVTGDTLVGARHESEWSNFGVHFGAGVNSTLESYRLGAGGHSNLSLGIGAIGGVSYYLTDSVALFLQMQVGYLPFSYRFGSDEEQDGPDQVNSVLFKGGMHF